VSKRKWEGGFQKSVKGLFQPWRSDLSDAQTATVNPAKFIGKEKEIGTMEKGKLADLVLLEANPLEKISNTQRISAVVAGGRYLPNEALRKLLTEVEATANREKPR